MGMPQGDHAQFGETSLKLAAADEWAVAVNDRAAIPQLAAPLSCAEQGTYPSREPLGRALRSGREALSCERRKQFASLAYDGVPGAAGSELAQLGDPSYRHLILRACGGSRGQALRPLDAAAPKVVHRHHHHHYHHHYPASLGPDARRTDTKGKGATSSAYSPAQRSAAEAVAPARACSAVAADDVRLITANGDDAAQAKTDFMAGQRVHLHYHHHACEEVVAPRARRLLDDATLRGNGQRASTSGAVGSSRCGAVQYAGPSEGPDTRLPGLA